MPFTVWQHVFAAGIEAAIAGIVDIGNQINLLTLLSNCVRVDELSIFPSRRQNAQ
jgi:hypothetical protein